MQKFIKLYEEVTNAIKIPATIIKAQKEAGYKDAEQFAGFSTFRRLPLISLLEYETNIRLGFQTKVVYF
jgi:hypothetical protein